MRGQNQYIYIYFLFHISFLNGRQHKLLKQFYKQIPTRNWIATKKLFIDFRQVKKKEETC